MKATMQWLWAGMVFGCACSASAPSLVQAPRLPDGVTIDVHGETRELQFILVDALGRVDSLEADGSSVAEIEGCTREYIDPEASTDESVGRSGGSTKFSFNRSPDWPLELWWRGEASDTIVVFVSNTSRNVRCRVSDRIASAGGKLSRLRIQRDMRGKPCALRIVNL